MQDGAGPELLARRFEERRPQLRALAYRMLGSLAEADDAVQEAWLRLAAPHADAPANLDAWLVTVVSRICLNVLRTRSRHPADRLPDPVVTVATGPGPEEEALVADAIGMALLVVLQTLTPLERLVFVLRDTFSVPYADIAALVGRSPAATRQLASRARRRVRGGSAAPVTGADRDQQRRVVDAFVAAARGGDLGALVATLHPDEVLRADAGGDGGVRTIAGAGAIARQALLFGALGTAEIRPVLVNGGPGVLAARAGRPVSVLGFTVVDGRVAAVDVLADPGRLQAMDLP